MAVAKTGQESALGFFDIPADNGNTSRVREVPAQLFNASEVIPSAIARAVEQGGLSPQQVALLLGKTHTGEMRRTPAEPSPVPTRI